MISELLIACRQLKSAATQTLLVILSIALGIGVVTTVVLLLNLNQRNEKEFTQLLSARELTLQEIEYDIRVFYSDVGEPRATVKLERAEADSIRFNIKDLEVAKLAAPTIEHAYLNQLETLQSPQLQNEEGILASAVTFEYQRAANIDLSAGSLLSLEDFEEKRQVILITPSVAKALNLNSYPIGQQVQFEEIGIYTVVGLMVDSVPESVGREDVVLPLQNLEDIDRLYFAVQHPRNLAQASEELKSFTSKQWGEGVSVSSARRSFDEFLTQQRYRFLLISLFASVGLLIASLNNMVLMLIGVLRRRHEIGIRRSLGANRLAIIKQFLLESVLLGLVGGTVGSFLSYVLLRAYNHYLAATHTQPVALVHYPPILPLVGTILALGMSILFSLYPAMIASRTRIIDALTDF